MNQQYLAITGRLPKLSLAELEAVFGADNIKPFSKDAVLIDTEVTPAIFNRLGGTLKLAKVLTELPNDWPSIEKYLFKTMPEHAELIEGKLNFGLSLYGINMPISKLQKAVLQFKKALKANGKSVRAVLNKELILSTAEVYHNKLAGNGWELLIVKGENTTLLAITEFVQDINAYAARDQKRPARDSRVGMLPPKLAQTIVNLAMPRDSVNPINEQMLLDPFCGTGVILQEALLMGYLVHGSDIEPRMISYTQQNINWLKEKVNYTGLLLELRPGDATTYRWLEANIIDAVACETYLGPPLTRHILPADLDKMIRSVNDLHEKFLKNIGSQIESGTRLCLAVPAWRTHTAYKHLPVLEKLDQLGYNWVEFGLVNGKELIYDRPGQFVARRLVTIIKK